MTSAMEAADQALLETHRRLLDRLVAETIRRGAESGSPPSSELQAVAPELNEERATFVTLTQGGRLRGCIGTITPHRPLVQDLSQNAFAAAFSDHRFTPVGTKDLETLRFSISLLSPMVPLTFTDEADLLDQVEPGRHGLLIMSRGRRSVFLPQVWKDLPDPKEFLARLKIKAGLPADHWDADFKAWIYTVAKSPETGLEIPPT